MGGCRGMKNEESLANEVSNKTEGTLRSDA